MEHFKDKVAVITGAASGIGRGIAEHCAAEGMKVVLADIEEAPLAKAKSDIASLGVEVTAVQTDVSKSQHMEELARQTLNSFGAVHLLCNNAGVGGGKSTWESTQKDWEWVMGVNLWGIIHGVRIFVPTMLEQDTECHIVNTASVAGLIGGSGMAVYKVTKHGVVTLSETLFHELAQMEDKVKISVLCPGFVNTHIMDSARNRPSDLHNDPASDEVSPETEERIEAFRQAVREGMPPLELARYVFEAIREERFYILPHPEFKEHVRTRMEDILEERNPTRD